MFNAQKSYEELIKRFCKWAEKRSDIRAAIVVGSRARVDHPADEWADLDIIILTTNPEYYVTRSDWISNIGKPLLTFIEPTATGDEKERRVLFSGMLDVDFSIIPKEKAESLLKAAANPQARAQISDLLSRGIRVLVDKDNVVKRMRSLVPFPKKTPRSPPTRDEFIEVVNDFLYHGVFTAKHLARGELWWTVVCLDCYMQRLLLTMMEWHALAIHNWKYDVWFRGRFLEEWAEPQAVKELSGAFAHYDREDIKRALFVTMDLFSRLATKTATKLAYAYPVEADRKVTSCIQKCLSQEA